MKCPGCGAPQTKIGLLRCEYCSCVLPQPHVAPTSFRSPPQQFNNAQFRAPPTQNFPPRPPQNWQNQNQWGSGGFHNPHTPRPPTQTRRNRGGIIALIVVLVSIFIIFPAIFGPVYGVFVCGGGCNNRRPIPPIIRSVEIFPGDWGSTGHILQVDQSMTFGVLVDSSTGNRQDEQVFWHSSDPFVAAVSQSGTVFAHTPGYAVITAESTINTTVSDRVHILVLPEQFATHPSFSFWSSTGEIWAERVWSSNLSAQAWILEVDLFDWHNNFLGVVHVEIEFAAGQTSASTEFSLPWQ